MGISSSTAFFDVRFGAKARHATITTQGRFDPESCTRTAPPHGRLDVTDRQRPTDTKCSSLRVRPRQYPVDLFA